MTYYEVRLQYFAARFRPIMIRDEFAARPPEGRRWCYRLGLKVGAAGKAAAASACEAAEASGPGGRRLCSLQ